MTEAVSCAPTVTLWHNGGNRYASTQEHRMSLDQAPPLKALDAPITFTVWYDYI